MKKIIAMILTASIASAFLCGCAQKETEPPTSTPSGDDTEITEEFDYPAEVEVTDELSGLFERAAATVVGVSYTPALFMGSVQGDPNVYCFLCSTVLAGYEESPYWTIVYITEDSDGNASVDEICIIDYGASCEADAPVIMGANPTEIVPGNWAPTTDLTVDDDLLNVYIESVIDIGMGGTLDVEKVRPEAVLASQVVAGMNYCFLNHWLNESSGTYYWSLEFVYADPEGNATMTNCYHLDIEQIYELV
ncbi:MAG: hypothetical protein J5685_07045 [Clostridiales bacterium]|nr:hypothetical protein [Clostridiales bacterium]